MSKYFLGSVGKAEAFKKDSSGNLQLAFVSKTLTDSGINISTTKDDIRGGEGAPIQFSFFHDPNVEITLTDILWKKEYLEAQIGANFDEGEDGQIDYITEKLTAASGVITLGHSIKNMPVACTDGKQYMVWYTQAGKDEWKSYTANDTFTTVTVGGSTDVGDYCVRYLAADSQAKAAEITSTIIPEELFLIITAPIFAGDACSASKGKAAGHITYEVPRFQLNGAQEFTMNMSQNQTMSLAGVALASASENCDTNAGKLLRIIEVLTDEDWYTNVKELIVDEDCLSTTVKPVIYALKKDGSIIKCINSKLIYRTTATGDYTKMQDGKTWAEMSIAAGDVYININADPTATTIVAVLTSDEKVTLA